MDNLLPILGGFFGVLAATVTGFFAWKQSKSTVETQSKFDVIKAETLSKAEAVKVKTEAETKRLDQLIDSQNKLLDRQDKRLATQDVRMDEFQKQINVCIEERSKFKSLYEALEVQFRHTEQFKNAQKMVDGNIEAKLEGKLNGKITKQSGNIP